MGDLRRAVGCCGAMVYLLGATPIAQQVELGGSLGVSCQGSDGSFCNDTHSGLRTAGPYVSVTVADRVEVSGRVAWLRQPDIAGNAQVPEPFSFMISNRRRVIAQGEAIWHFRPGKRVRPLLGLGLGRYRDRDIVSCAPPGCESRINRIGLTEGGAETSHPDRSIVAGLSVLLHGRVRLHGGWRYHNPLYDELALSEVFLAVGFRP